MEVSEASDSGAKEPSAEPSSSECPPAIAGVIDSLAHAAKVDSNQLKKIFTNELIQKLQSLEPAVLMLTLTTLLTTMAQSSAENRSETDGGDDNTTETQKGSGRKRRKTDRSDSESKEVAQRRMLGSSIGGSEDQQVTSTTAGVYENKIPVEMDIDDSDDGVSVDSRQSSVTGRRVCVSSGSSEANSRDKKPAAYDNSPFPPLPPESESFCPQYPMGDGSEMAFTHGHQYNPPAPVPPPQPVFNVKQRRDFASEVIFAPQDVSGGHPRFSDPFHPTVESTQLFQPPQQPQMFQSGNFCQNPTLSLESIISTLPAAIGGQLKGLMDTPIANPFGAGFQPTMGTSAPPAIDTATHNALAQLLGQAVRNLNVAVNNEIRSRVPPMDVVGMNFRPQSAPIRAPHPQPEIGVGYSPNQPRPLFRRDNYAPSPQEYYGGNPMIAAPHGGNFPQESFGGHVQPPRFRRPPPSHQPDYHHPDGFYHPDHPRFSRPFQRPGGPSRGQPQFYPRPTGFPRRFPPPQYQDYQEEYDWEEEESAGPYLPWEQPPVRQNFPGRFQRS